MSNAKDKKEEFIVFILGKQEFCIEITSVREIRGWTPTTILPHSPSSVLGVINLRGTILPIVDLSKRFGLETNGPTERHAVIVAQVADKIFGLLVDSVSDILDASEEDLRSMPDVESELSADFFNRVLVLDERIICEVRLENLVPDMDAVAA